MSFGLCFPETAKIWKNSIQNLSIKDLTVGQKVSENKDYFLGYLHFEPDNVAEYLEIRCDNGKAIIISEEHFIFRNLKEAVPAGDIKIGDSLVYNGGPVEVVSIQRVTCVGVYAPLSTSGTLVIDGFLVSCYAHVKSHEFAHKSMAPLRFWLQNVQKVHKKNKGIAKAQQEGMHGYAKFLIKFQSLIPIKA